jgi:hypothetical protein
VIIGDAGLAIQTAEEILQDKIGGLQVLLIRTDKPVVELCRLTRKCRHHQLLLDRGRL